METTKRCPYCGQEIIAKSKFCVHCGAKQEVTPDSSQGITYETGVANSPDNTGASLFKSCFWEQITKHYCDFKGRVDRKTFWIWYLYYSLIMFVINGFSIYVPLLGLALMVVLWFGLLLPFLGLTVRRFRDIGKKWTWFFVILIPIVGPIWYLVLMAEKGVLKNNNQWTVKDTIITIVMSIVGLGLFFMPSSSRSEGGYEEVLFSGHNKDLDEAELKFQFGLINFIARNEPFSNYMDSDLKSIYEMVREKEKEYGVSCECLNLIRQMESEYKTIDVTDCYFMEDNQALVVGETSFNNYPNGEVTMMLKYERENSPFANHNSIIKVLVSDVYSEKDDMLLSDCMIDWLVSEPYLHNDNFNKDGFTYNYIIDKDLSAKIEKQVVEDYKTQTIYNCTTPDFEAAEDAALAAEDFFGYLCVDLDYFYQSQDLELDQLNVKAQAKLLNKDNAHVFVTLYSENKPSLVLVMLRDDKTGKWLVDDIKDTDNNYSVKEGLLDCANEYLEMLFVVIDVSDLRLRLAPSLEAETLKLPDGTNKHPNKGDKFEYLGELTGFYKIRYNGETVWVSKDYTHVETGSQTLLKDNKKN